ncbi:methyltransferase FkbM [Helicobacter sp. XJK30-2]|uniref:Methyltransferase FkbM n=1 Tax=Helicobacter zhangjianzhongii TaxID=2974574 RepID=A0ACC6FS15_9HELI|nr:methyltransferase FkbM [Helicobacter sp. XJK30-2]MDL0082069.1 methyltransferase FkbM [Helicobacter sp. XJK30-2]
MQPPIYRCQNAVLLLFFNRLDTTLAVLAQIAKVQPKVIYLAQDGARDDKELAQAALLRRRVIEHITWECKIHTRFLDTNLGCKLAVSSAISWFFSQEKQGIILEDDCLPSISFFRFCDELLERYSNEQKVFMISGWSGLDFAKNTSVETLHPKAQLQEDYFFSKYPHIWGWASWARAWQKYQLEFSDFEAEFRLLDNFYSVKEKRYWYKILKAYAQGKINTWDYPLAYSVWKHKGLCIYPKNNMIKNIGFNRDDATHTTGESKFATMPSYELAFPIIHPSSTQAHAIDTTAFHIAFHQPSIYARIAKKLTKLFKASTIPKH